MHNADPEISATRPYPARSRLTTALATVLMSASIEAAVITVTSTEDTTLPDECTLWDAIRSATYQQSYGSCTPGDSDHNEIVFASELGPSIQLQLGALIISEPLTITGPGPDHLTIDAQNASPIFITEAATTFSGLTVKNGFISSDSSHSNGGAAFYASADLTLDDMVVTGNVSDHSGGAIRTTFNADLVIRNSEITHNSSQREGGGIHSEGPLEVENSIISYNQAHGTEHGGGGIHARNGAIISDSLITRNETFNNYSSGGGIYLHSGKLTLTGSEVSHNKTNAPNSPGGGIHIHSGSRLEVRTSTIAQNVTSEDNSSGGGISVRFGTFDIQDSEVIDNLTVGEGSHGAGIFKIVNGASEIKRSTIHANINLGDDTSGGGISLYGDLTIDQSTLSYNYSFGSHSPGGAITANGDLEIINSTLSYNSAPGVGSTGGAIYQSNGLLRLQHATLANNQSWDNGNAVYFDLDSESAFLAYNSIFSTIREGDEICNKYFFTGSTNNLVTSNSCGEHGLLDESVATVSEIGLGSLRDNGGMTRTHTLSANSIAVDQAAYHVCTNDSVSGLDQRGVPRSQKSKHSCDIGAYELKPLIDYIFTNRFE